MTAKPAKPSKKAGSATADPGASSVKALVDGEKSFFRLRACADTLGTPNESEHPGARRDAVAEGGLFSRWLRASSPRQPRRRAPAAPAEPVQSQGSGDTPVTGTVIEPEQDASSPEAADESYRSASDLTASEDPKKSEFVA